MDFGGNNRWKMLKICVLVLYDWIVLRKILTLQKNVERNVLDNIQPFILLIKKTIFLIFLYVAALVPLSVVASSDTVDGNRDEGLKQNLKKEYYVNKIKDSGLDLSKKRLFLDSAERADILLPTEMLKDRVEIYICTGNFNKAIAILGDALNAGVDSSSRLYALYNMAYCQQATGNYEKALDNIFQIYRCDKAVDQMSYKLYSDFLLARIYRVAGQYEKSDSVLSGVWRDIPAVEKDSVLRSRLEYKYHLELASSFLDEKKYSEALSALKEASKFKMDNESASLVLMGMSELYHHIGESAIAEDYYRRFIDESSSPINRVYAINNFCLFLVDEQRYDEAIALCLEQIGYTSENGIAHVEASLYSTLAQALYAKQKYKGAYDAYKKSREILDTLLVADGQRITEEFEKRLASYRYPDVPQSGLNLWESASLICIVVVLAVAVILLSMRIWNSKRLSKMSMLLKAEGIEVEGGYVDEGEDDEAKRENLSLTLQLAEVGQLLDNVFEIALSKDLDDIEKRKKLNALRLSRTVNSNFWNLFRTSFEKNYPTFSQRLHQLHSDLSKGEIRLCSFIIMGLSTKDIAMLTNRSVRTVESMKYRLNKKLNLKDGLSVELYLRSLC